MTWSTVTEYLCIKCSLTISWCISVFAKDKQFLLHKWHPSCCVLLLQTRWSDMNEDMTWIVITANGTYPWSFDTQIFRNGWPSHVSDCLFDIFNFFSTFWNILRTKYCCPRTIVKNVNYIRKLVYQDYKNCINVCPSVCAWSICKSPNKNLIAETSYRKC
jgi:hypothetical protein